MQDEPSFDASGGLKHVERLAYAVGTGNVSQPDGRTLLRLAEADEHTYSNAQLDDYHQSGDMQWRPPLQFSVRARFSQPQHALRGTAGFGFWNDPFGMTRVGTQRRWWPRVRFPQAIWFFFAAPPSNMALAHGVDGFGWKAATIDASSFVAKALLPFTPLGMLACRVPFLYQTLWPIAQRVLKIDERLLHVMMDDWHDYHLDWGAGSARFVVDGTEVLRTPFAPRGPLGFVAWIDNQYMIATPQGKIRNGVVAASGQWLETAELDLVRN